MLDLSRRQIRVLIGLVIGLIGAFLIDPPQAFRVAWPSLYQPRETVAHETRQTGEGDYWSLHSVLARAEDGDAKAMLALGVAYADGAGMEKDDSKAVLWLRQAAQASETVAQYRMGLFNETGRGMPKNPAEAFRWYTEAAQKGHRSAMHNLAVAYAGGSGTSQDFAQAARWFQAAADLGAASSQFNLAILYDRGAGVMPSLAEAYRWYSIAAANGDIEARAYAEARGAQLPAVERRRIDDAVFGFRPQVMNAEANIPPRITPSAEQ